jgi:hypothetical protein
MVAGPREFSGYRKQAAVSEEIRHRPTHLFAIKYASRRSLPAVS